MRGPVITGLALALAACAPAGPLPLPAPTAAVSVLPATTTPAPLASAPDPNGPTSVAFMASLDTTRPCLGRPFTLNGRGYPAGGRVTAWIKTYTPEGAIINGSETLDRVAHAVKLADFQADAAGTFSVPLTLRSKQGPLTTGGDMVLTPGANATLVLVDAAGARGIGFEVAMETCDGEVAAAPLKLTITPRFPCGDEPVTVRGEGFTGAEAALAFARPATRFDNARVPFGTVAVGADGTFTKTLRLSEARFPDGTPFLADGATATLEATDPASNRLAGAPLPGCNDGLRVALEAPSIAVPPGILGTLYVLEPSVTPRALDGAAASSAAELKAAFGRFGIRPDAVDALPAVDYARDQVLVAALTGRMDPLEIVGVEDRAGERRVHVVAWSTLNPTQDGTIFHLVTAPRRDVPVRFLTAMGDFNQRTALAPRLGTWAPRRLSGYPGQPLSFSP